MQLSTVTGTTVCTNTVTAAAVDCAASKGDSIPGCQAVFEFEPASESEAKGINPKIPAPTCKRDLNPDCRSRARTWAAGRGGVGRARCARRGWAALGCAPAAGWLAQAAGWLTFAVDGMY